MLLLLIWLKKWLSGPYFKPPLSALLSNETLMTTAINRRPRFKSTNLKSFSADCMKGIVTEAEIGRKIRCFI